MSTPTDDTTGGTDGLAEQFERFLGRYYEDAVAELAQEYPSDRRTLTVDWMDLYRFDTGLARDVVELPDVTLPQFAQGLDRVSLPVVADFEDANVAVTNVGADASYRVGETRSDDIGRYVEVAGQVVKTSSIKPRIRRAAFECQRCGTLTKIPQSGNSDQLDDPQECRACERAGPFQINREQSEWIDHQAVRLQRPPEDSEGTESATLDVVIEDDLVGEVKAGDRAAIAGIHRVAEPDRGQVFDPYLDCRGVDVRESEWGNVDVDEHEEEIEAIAAGERGDPLDLFVESLAPHIYGMGSIKCALVLQLFGGVNPNNGRDRGDSHILLVGDPGNAKSELLQSVEEVAPRAKYASGKGMTAAGATAAAVKDGFGDGEWSLEAGVMVLADGGVACIDELDKVDPDAVSSMHDALESQRVAVSKAGINATLSARTALLAAANPELGRFDAHQPIAEQLDFDVTLLSRFDLIFTVTDQPSEEDRDIAEHIIDSRRTAIKDHRGDRLTDAEEQKASRPIDLDVMRAYIAHARQNVHPTITDPDVKKQLEDYFTSLRQAGGDDGPVPVTFRQIEGMLRLAEASARVRLSDTVTEEDLQRAVRLVMDTMEAVGVDPETGNYDVDIIETGVSQTQRQQIHGLMDLIEELEAEGDEHWTTMDELVERAIQDLGLTERKARDRIEKLKRDGRVYSPEGQDTLKTL